MGSKYNKKIKKDLIIAGIKHVWRDLMIAVKI